jgi:DNA-binding NtrC family response regulator
MWQSTRSIFASLWSIVRKNQTESAAPVVVHESGPHRSRITIVSILLDDQDRSLIADVCYENQWEVFFAKTCAEARQVSEQIKPHIILLDRDLTDGDWRDSLSACASSSAGACTMLISRVADDYLWNEVVRNGGYDVLPKPLREQTVLHAVKFAWSYWNSARQATSIPRSAASPKK